MSSLNDLQLASWETLTGNTGQLNDLLVEYLQSLAGITSDNPNDLWYKVLTDLGYTGTVQDMQLEYWEDITGKTGTWNDLYYEWLLDTGGAFGPNVNIALASGGSCTYQPATTTDCTAVGTYTANDSGFTNPADTWLWTIEPPVVGVDLTDATLKTCTVTTPTSDVNLDFNLKVVATDSVSTDTANRTTAFTQTHTDTNTVPVFIGPNVNDVQFTQDQPLSDFDFSVLFTGTNLVYDNTGTLPLGLVLNASTGILNGTPTQAEVQAITVTATNSKGVAATNSFNMTVINQSQTLDVAQVLAGSCDYLFPQVGCTAQGTYDATPSGWTSPPDTWVWSITTITTGLPVITAGQGTATVTVDSTGADTAGFTLKCVASNVGTETAQDLTQFTQVHTDDTVAIAFDGPNIADQTFQVGVPFTLDVSTLFSGNPIQTWALLGTWPTSFAIDGSGVITGTSVIGDVGTFANLGVRASNAIPDSADSNLFNGDVVDEVLPAFYALTPDETTYEMLGVSIGTGDLTTTHTSTLYAPDFEGVYREFAANEAVWAGGRQVINYASYSESPNNWVYTGTVNEGIVAGIGPNGEDAVQVSWPSPGTGRVRLSAVGTAGGRPEPIVGYVQAWLVRAVSGTSTFRLRNASDFTAEIVVDENWTVVSQVGSIPGTHNIADSNTSLFSAVGQTNNLYIVRKQVDWFPEATDIPSEYISNLNTTFAGDPAVFANENGNTVASNVVTEAVGTPLPETPYLQYYPAATNSELYSNDITNVGGWTISKSGPDVLTFDQVGLTGEPNTATLYQDNSTGNTTALQNVTVANDSATHTMRIFIKKDVSATAWPQLEWLYQDGTIQRLNIYFNHATGATAVAGGNDVGVTAREVIDLGDWWAVLISVQNNTTGNVRGQMRMFIANTDDMLTTDLLLNGQIIIGNVEVHLNKTIAEVRGLGPIFTTTAAVSTDAVVSVHDSANSSDVDSTWYAEVTSEGAQNIIDGFLSIVGTNFQLSDGTTTVTQPWTVSVLNRVGIVYDDTNMAINVEGSWSADVAYDDTMLQGILDLFRATSDFGGQIREYQRFDSATLAAGKSIIDDLMAAPVSEGVNFTDGEAVLFTDGEYVKFET